MWSATIMIHVYIICEGTSSSPFYRQRNCTQRNGKMFSRSKSQTWMSLNWNLSSFDFIFPIMSYLFCLHQEFMFFENKNINLTKISPFFSSFISNVSYIQMEIYSSCLWGLLWSDPPEKHSLFVQAVQSFCLSRHNWMLITSIKLSLITLCEALLFFYLTSWAFSLYFLLL